MKRLIVVIFSVGLLAAGIAMELRALSEPEPPSVEPDPRLITPLDNAAGSPAGANPRFVLDVSDMLTKLNTLRPDEHPDQIADWAVYGTLVQAGFSSDAVRQAAYNMVPLRLPSLEEVFDFDYGPGRRVFLPDGSVWLFYSARDDQATATLARLADQVRMERGVLPASFAVFRYRSELVEGAIYVEREADIPGQALFSPEYGYIEQRIVTAEDLIAWLNRIDDVTHVKKLDGGLELGGRRFAGVQTATVNAEDVVALYQAHRRLADASRDIDRQMQAASKPLVEAFDALVDLYNQNIHNYNRNRSVSFDGRRFAQAVAAVEKYLGNAPSADSLQSKDISTQRRLVDALEPRVQRRVEELERDRYRELFHAGKLPADEPGFSLDPQWDVPSLLRDLAELLKNPAAIIRPALKVAGKAKSQEVDESAPRRIIISALGVASAFGGSDPDAYRVQDKWRKKIATIVSSIRGKSGRQVEEGAIVPFLELKKELKEADEEQAQQLWVILDHLESLHRAQCARYDGPLQGTHVGMNLFYTDILAKLWASLDYYGAAPINEVYGFRSGPLEDPYLEALYWTEQWALPATRLWFGPKGEAYKGDPQVDSGLNFAHISTRVYSAGSNPLNPGEETMPREGRRRIYGWWDRHFARVADYEQAYHVQNQIMKWSVITGWMAENDVLPDLEKLLVNRSHRFDHWYAVSKDLRFRRAIAFLPEDRWLGGTECVEILRSYLYPSAGRRWTFTEGGVSLGSSKSLQTASHITQEIPSHLRRGGLDYSVSKPGKLSELKLVTLKKTTFEFPPAQADRAAVKASIPERARLRVGPTEMATKKLITEVVTQGGGGRITLASERGVVGELHLERTGDRVRMLWRDGNLEADRIVLEDVGILFRKGESAAPRLATFEQFLPHRGGYVIERESQGVEVIRMQAAGAGKGSSPPLPNGGSGHPPPPDGSGPPRMFRAVADDPGAGDGDVYLRTSVLPRWWMIVAPLDDAPKLNVEAVALDATKALEHLNGTRWQRLRPLSGDAGESPALVERVFTNRGPPETARPIRIKTHHPELGELHGYVEEGTLFLERPQDGALHPRFNELVVSEGISSNYVAEVVLAARQTAADAVYTAQPAFSTDALRGLRAASYAAEGDYAAALAELRAASNGGNLRSAVESYTRQLPTDLLAQLREGVHSPAAAQFAHGNLPGQNADAQLIVALSALRRHRPREAGNILRTALDEVPPSAAFAKAADGVFGSASIEAAHDYILAHHGSINGLSPEVAPHIGLQPAGFRLHTVLPKRELKGGKMLSRTEQVDLATIFRDQPPSAIYVEDSKLLNKLDWDGAPGPSLSKIMKDPDVAWERLDTDAMGGFRPSFLLDGDTQFVRRDPTSVAQRPVRVNSVRPHAYLVRSCDADGNGMVSDQERARCVNE